MTMVDLAPAKRREITSGTREWADHNVNCIKGCLNNCRYCYAKIMAKRFGRCTEDTWQEMQINHNVLSRKFRRYNGRVMFPSSHDIVDKPEIKEACFVVIGRLLEAGNRLLVTTKPKLSITKNIIDRFYPFKEQLQFRFTITSLDNQLLSFWEPNAPTYEERFESLKYAYENEFKTSVSIEPFLDYAPQTLVFTLSPFVTESIWLGPMNYISQNCVFPEEKQLYAEIRKRYTVSRLREIYEELKDFPLIRFKDSMNNRLHV
jgi:DNA repair photolyase